jgi:hypothetical protein
MRPSGQPHLRLVTHTLLGPWQIDAAITETYSGFKTILRWGQRSLLSQRLTVRLTYKAPRHDHGHPSETPHLQVRTAVPSFFVFWKYLLPFVSYPNTLVVPLHIYSNPNSHLGRFPLVCCYPFSHLSLSHSITSHHILSPLYSVFSSLLYPHNQYA